MTKNDLKATRDTLATLATRSLKWFERLLLMWALAYVERELSLQPADVSEKPSAFEPFVDGLDMTGIEVGDERI